MSGASATGSRDCPRVRPRVSTVGQTLRTFGAFLQAALVIALVAWLVWRGAEAMQYRWQWERVPRYLVRVVDGGWVWAPLMRGLGTTVRVVHLVFRRLLRKRDHSRRALGRTSGAIRGGGGNRS